MLIAETIFEAPLEVITEEHQGKKQLFIEGVFLECEKLNRNKRRYPRKVIEESLEAFQEKVANGQGFGCLGHDDSTQLDISKISHRIVSMNFDKNNPNNVLGRAVILDNGAGAVLSSILRSGGTIGASSRGTGSTKKDKDGNHVVQSPFKLISIDAVLEPSTNQMVKMIMEEYEGDEGYRLLTEMFTESAAFDAAFAEYKKRQDTQGTLGQRKKSKTPKSNIEVLSSWLKKIGERELANLISNPTKHLLRKAHLGRLHRAVKKAYREATKATSHPNINTKPEVDDNEPKSRFWEYRKELAEFEIKRNKNKRNNTFGQNTRR